MGFCSTKPAIGVPRLESLHLEVGSQQRERFNCAEVAIPGGSTQGAADETHWKPRKTLGMVPLGPWKMADLREIYEDIPYLPIWWSGHISGGCSMSMLVLLDGTPNVWDPKSWKNPTVASISGEWIRSICCHRGGNRNYPAQIESFAEYDRFRDLLAAAMVASQHQIQSRSHRYDRYGRSWVLFRTRS